MSVLLSQSLLPDFIKMRWLEPYVSSGLNRKTFKSIPRGIYNGFIVKPGLDPKSVTIHSDDPDGWGLTSGYSYGAFDSASGWSVAVHANLNGYTSTIAFQAGGSVSGSGNYDFDLAAYAGSSVFLALDVQYGQGYASTAQIKVLEAEDLDADPTIVVIAKVVVPSVGSITQSNIIYDDLAYPRILPFADIYKYGFMSKDQAYHLDLVSSNAVSGSPAFEEEVLISVDGQQNITLPSLATYTFGGDDLWVFRNGVKAKKGALRDYTEIDRGDGRGEEIAWVGTSLKDGDRIIFRVQKYSAVLSSTTKILDEDALIESNAIELNFTGPGVVVTPDGYRRVNVRVPGGGSANGVRQKYNYSGSVIAQYRAVHIDTDNTVIYCDPTNPVHKFYGITLQSIPHGFLGDIAVNVVAEGAGGSVSGSGIGLDVYVAHTGDGRLTTTPPDPLAGRVIKVGIIDGPDGVSGGAATDIIFERAVLS